MFKESLSISGRLVGPEEPCLVIAEAGVSHFGDMGLARELIDLAFEAKADVFKTQIFDVDRLISTAALDWRDRLRDRNLTFDQISELKSICERKGLIFMTTAHDESRIDWLRRLDVSVIKVGSGEKNNLKFISSLAELGKPLIVSTGMSSEAEVKRIIDTCAVTGNLSLALLHCVTSYPTPVDQVNLSAMKTIQSFFTGPVGYSDHTEDGFAVFAAVALGAKLVERHITIKKNVPNAQDWKVSSGPEDFPAFVRRIREIESMLGSGVKQPSECERDGMLWALKSLVAARDLQSGRIISEADFLAQRPGTGFPPTELSKLIGKRLKRSLGKGEVLAPEHLES